MELINISQISHNSELINWYPYSMQVNRDSGIISRKEDAKTLTAGNTGSFHQLQGTFASMSAILSS